MFHLPFEPQAAANLPGPLHTVMSNGYQRTREMTISQLLLDNRILFLGSSPETGNFSEINDLKANVVIQYLLWLATDKKTADIHLYINSPGGSLSAGLAIYDAMQFVGCPINTYCVGTAASMAAVLLAAGTKGKRFALPNSKVLIHQPRVYEGMQGQVTDLEIYAAEIQKEKERMNQILAQHTGQSVEHILKSTDRDYFMTADEAKAFGIVDQVLVKPVDGAKK
jgi:ATP-dependent Clp protease protease subunit